MKGSTYSELVSWLSAKHIEVVRCGKERNRTNGTECLGFPAFPALACITFNVVVSRLLSATCELQGPKVKPNTISCTILVPILAFMLVIIAIHMGAAIIVRMMVIQNMAIHTKVALIMKATFAHCLGIMLLFSAFMQECLSTPM